MHMLKTGITLALALAATSALAQPAPLSPQKAELRALFKEMIETDTSITTGSCTLGAERVAARMKAAKRPGSAAKSPAMLFYLDNWMSAAPNAQAMQRREKVAKALERRQARQGGKAEGPDLVRADRQFFGTRHGDDHRQQPDIEIEGERADAERGQSDQGDGAVRIQQTLARRSTNSSLALGRGPPARAKISETR